VRILVTGGAGYIGSHAARHFMEKGHEVWAYDNLVYGHRAAAPAGRLITSDLADFGTLDAVLAEKKIEAIVHFAAFCYVGESVTDPAKYYRNNTAVALGLLETAQRRGIKRFVFSSTCATYGDVASVPIREDFPQQPINPYGRSKLMVEWALADYAAAYGMGYAALRYFNASGAHPSGEIGEDHEPETHLLPLVLQVALGQRANIKIFGDDYPTPDGTCIRDYIHVEDLASAHLLALEKLEAGSALKMNLGTGRGYSVRQAIDLCAEVTGKPIATEIAPRRPGDPPELVADASLARRELGWTPRYADLREIVATAWNWHSRHPRGYDDRGGKKGDA